VNWDATGQRRGPSYTSSVFEVPEQYIHPSEDSLIQTEEEKSGQKYLPFSLHKKEDLNFQSREPHSTKPLYVLCDMRGFVESPMHS
jgi:hypothetical protein